ncbi:hypothetical protein BGX26_011430 [Mortierella sp. AD094]|nr:hypothetical protein BGX26_011430 [Mortierella sp. AD094]
MPRAEEKIGNLQDILSGLAEGPNPAEMELGSEPTESSVTSSLDDLTLGQPDEHETTSLSGESNPTPEVADKNSDPRASTAMGADDSTANSTATGASQETPTAGEANRDSVTKRLKWTESLCRPTTPPLTIFSFLGQVRRAKAQFFNASSNMLTQISHDREEQEITLEELFSNCTASQIRSRIDQTHDLVVRKDEASCFPKSTVRIFDTPGLNDTNGHDERHVAKILSALSDAGAVHLVLIMISQHTPMSLGLKEALENYSNIFSAMRGLIAFVHTKVDCTLQYVPDKKSKTFKMFLDERTSQLAEIMGRKIPHFFIDCDLEEYRPVRLYSTRQVIHELFQLAKLNVPVPLSRMQLRKTKKMLEIDAVVAIDYEKRLAVNREQYSRLDEKLNEIARKNGEKISDNNIRTKKNVEDIDGKIKAVLIRFQDFDEYLKNNDTEELLLVREKKVSEIEKKSVEGGEGYNYWRVKLARKDYFKSGYYRVKLYVKRCNKLRLEIKEKRIERSGCRKELNNLNERRSFLIAQLDSLPRDDAADAEKNAVLEEARKLNAESAECLNMFARANRPTLHLNLFKAIAEARVYEGETKDCIRKVPEFYSKYVPGEGEEAPLEQDPL